LRQRAIGQTLAIRSALPGAVTRTDASILRQTCRRKEDAPRRGAFFSMPRCCEFQRMPYPLIAISVLMYQAFLASCCVHVAFVLLALARCDSAHMALRWIRQPPPAEPLSVSNARLRRTFVKGVGRNTNGMERLAIDRAARLTAIAELAAENPATSANDLVRLDGAAHRARRDMARVLQAKPEPSHGDALERYLAAKHGETAA
jgi:hypothetical protein